MATNSNTTKSRLLTSTTDLRNKLVARNLYAPDTEYPLQNPNTVTKTLNTINTIIGGITPFKSFNLENTVYGRIATSDVQTPLTTIGLSMLGKQFALNAASSIAQDHFPIIKVGNLFDGKDSTKLFTKRIEYSITIKSGNTNFQNFLNSAVYYYPAKDYPFSKEPSNDNFIEATGAGQLQMLYKHLNKNLFKQDISNTVFYDTADKVKESIQKSNTLINKDSKGGTFFSFDNNKFYPYVPFPIEGGGVGRANTYMINAVNNNNVISSEYGYNLEYIGRLGAPTKKVDQALIHSNNEWIDGQNEFIDNLDKNENKIVWGRDGIDETTNAFLEPLRGDGIDIRDVKDEDSASSFVTDFKVENGLLAYTKNLVIATRGKIGDMTRKAYITDENKIAGFQGSGLYQANDTKYSRSEKTGVVGGIANKRGVRQHNALDQYDRFAKAIRFDGNNVYNGNPNSVIYNSVLPRIHPSLSEEGELNNKNLMLSIENLAVKVISKDGVGIIDDEYGSAIPACEVGPFNGRIMWFPPFNMQIQETAIAKYEPTVMVGRNEPMYNYMNSERTATLNFTLLIDYPPQVKNLRNSKTPQRDLTEFFAFGGDPYAPDKSYVENLQLQLTLIQLQIDGIYDKGPLTIPELQIPNPYHLYFPNDVPKVSDSLSSIVNDMYKKYDYEILQNFRSSDGGLFGLNRDMYFITGVTPYNISGQTYYRFNSPPSVNQYTAIGTTDQFGESEFNKMLRDTFENPEYREYYGIEITGGASKLYTEGNPKDVKEEIAYNKALGLRRANAAKSFVQQRLSAMFGSTVLNQIKITSTISKGSSEANPTGATAAAIPLRTTKEERYAEIKIVKNDLNPPTKTLPLTIQEQQTIDILIARMTKIQTEINDAQNVAQECVLKERSRSNDAILNGFKSVTGNYYYPVFHSQTPEDFHKRLTFLNQCTRQGSAKKYDAEVDANGVLRARNSVFGRQPICILRVGDFFYTKVIIESVNVDYTDTTWDMNPEGFGMQPMLANITLNMKLIGGQSLKGPIDALQNAVSFNYYANSNYTKEGMYILPSAIAELQDSYKNGVSVESMATIKDFNKRNAEFKATLKKNKNNKE